MILHLVNINTSRFFIMIFYNRCEVNDTNLNQRVKNKEYMKLLAFKINMRYKYHLIHFYDVEIRIKLNSYDMKK